MKLLPNKLKKAELEAGDFTDLYDEKGNPLYESTDSEASDAEQTVVKQLYWYQVH